MEIYSEHALACVEIMSGINLERFSISNLVSTSVE
jgi:hypothetical protein